MVHDSDPANTYVTFALGTASHGGEVLRVLCRVSIAAPSCFDRFVGVHSRLFLRYMQAEELAALKAELEPALRAALAEASASTKTAEREEAARIKTELRARTVTDSLSVELETARAGAHDLEERVRLLERVRATRAAGIHKGCVILQWMFGPNNLKHGVYCCGNLREWEKGAKNGCRVVMLFLREQDVVL